MRCREARPGAIGSTKRGIGPTYESKAARTGIRIDDLIRPRRLRQALERYLDAAAPLLRDLGAPPPDIDAIAAEYSSPRRRDPALRARRLSISARPAAAPGKIVLFEGAQGVLLDLDHGTYPYVTSSSTTAGGACAACGVGPTYVDEVVGIVKAYATRVGNGPFPTELLDETGERLREVGAEFGATTGRPRRCGWLDIPALRLAVRLSGIQHLALTKLDVLGGLDVIKLCVGYRLRGKVLDELPVDPEDIEAISPIYEELPGWPAEVVQPGQARARSRADLPSAAQRYLERIGELVGLPFSLISIGPGREDTILERDVFGSVG